MPITLLNQILLACAFLVGFLVPRSSTCAVAAVREIRLRQTAWRFGGFGLIVLTGVFVRAALTWQDSIKWQVAPVPELSMLILVGGFVFGVGATINGACVFGTLTKIVGGETSFLLVIVGIWIGTLALGALKLDLIPQTTASVFTNVSPLEQASFIVIAAGAWLCGLVWFWRKDRLVPAVLATGVGLTGNILYSLHPYWGYASIVTDFAHQAILSPIHMGDALLPWLVASACAGGFLSRIASGRFSLRSPKLRTSLGAIVGGFLMAFGIAMIPGGNDGLVLSLLPSLVPSGIAAYVAMNLGIVATLHLEGVLERRSRRKAPLC